MLAELSLRIRTDQEISFRNSSLFQGALMERVEKTYAEKMHQTGLHPYSQYLCVDNKDLIWKIKTLDDESYKGIIEPWMVADVNSFKLTKKDINVEILEKSLVTRDEHTLLKRFYSDDTDKYIKVNFESPTAFKRDEKYVFMPEVSLIFGSLMRKYSAASSAMSMDDKETLDYIVAHTSITSFKIRSTSFPLEGVKVPAFLGEITFKFSGTDTMSRYARLLLEYGEFSGVGIKCGIGMGAIKIVRGGKDGR